MNAQISEVAAFAIALELSLAVERLDDRISFGDDDLETIGCLNDLVALLNEKLANTIGPAVTAKELIDKAVQATFPSVDRPSKTLPLHQAFHGHNSSPPGKKRR